MQLNIPEGKTSYSFGVQLEKQIKEETGLSVSVYLEDIVINSMSTYEQLKQMMKILEPHLE
jgi:hypothetical protein